MGGRAEPAASDERDPVADVPAGVYRLNIALGVLSALLLGAVALLVPAPWPGWERFLIVVGFGALCHLDSTYILRGAGKVRISFSFTEIGLLAALVYLPGAAAVWAALASTLIYEVAGLRQPVKAVFNACQWMVGTCVAVLVLAALPPLGSYVAGVSLVSASLAVLAYVLTTSVIWLLLLRVLIGPGVGEEFLSTIGIDTVGALGTTSVGVVGLHLLTQDVVLLAYSVVPLAAILMAYRLMRISRELTAQRSADAEGLRRLVSSVTDGIVMVDADGVVRVWNPVLESLTGVDAGAAEGLALSEVLIGVTRVADAPLGAEAATLATWRDGRVMEERTSQVRGDDELDGGRVIVLRDVTRQQEADALKSDFVARVSHELRTPLTPLAGFIALLRGRGDQFDARTHAAALDAMTRNTRRMSTLVDELLVVVELDGGLHPRTAAIDLAGAVQAGRERLRLDSSGHTLRLDVPAGTFAVGDADRLSDVLGHLLDNAIRYSPAGTAIDVTAAEEDGTVVVRVRDRGPGIPSAAHELVFERFSRLEAPMRMQTSGLGLGLFISRQLTESMGGSLTIASSDAAGTTMEVRLPALG